MITIDVQFTPELTPIQEKVFQGETYVIYQSLKEKMLQIANYRNSWNFRLSKRISGEDNHVNKITDEVCVKAREYYDNLCRCATGEIPSDDALFIFERVNDSKNKYIIMIRADVFTSIKVNPLFKKNVAEQLIEQYKNNFNSTVKRMRYKGDAQIQIHGLTE